MNGNGRIQFQNNPEFISFAEDLSKICAALPNVPMQTVFTGLMKLPKKDRRSAFLQNYFKENAIVDLERNEFNRDVKIINELIPDCPRESIVNELVKVQNKEFRIQFVLKSYFDSQNKKLKRPLEVIDVNPSPDKKIKITEITNEEAYIIDLENDVNLQNTVIKNSRNIDNKYIRNKSNETITPKRSVITVLRELFPDSTNDELLKICRDYGYVMSDVLSEDVLNMFINQVICSRSTSVDECFNQNCQEPQPSTSSYGLKQASSSCNDVILSQTSTSTEEYDLNDSEKFNSLFNLMLDDKTNPVNGETNTNCNTEQYQNKNKILNIPSSSTTNNSTVNWKKILLIKKGTNENENKPEKFLEIGKPTNPNNETVQSNTIDTNLPDELLITPSIPEPKGNNVNSLIDELDGLLRKEITGEPEKFTLPTFAFDANLSDYAWPNVDEIKEELTKVDEELTEPFDASFSDINDVVTSLDAKISEIDLSFVKNAENIDIDLTVPKPTDKNQTIAEYIDLSIETDKSESDSDTDTESETEITRPEIAEVNVLEINPPVQADVDVPVVDMPVVDNNNQVLNIPPFNNINMGKVAQRRQSDVGLMQNAAGPSKEKN